MPINSQIPLAFRAPQIESPLAQYGQMVQIQHALQQQEMAKRKLAEEEAARAAISQLPPDATEDDVLKAVRPHVSVDVLGKMLTSSQDRKAQIAATAEQAKARLAQQAENATMLHELRLRNLSNAEDKAAEVARHNQVMESIQQQNANVSSMLRGLGLSIQKERLDLSKAEAGRKEEDQKEKKVQQLQGALERANLPEAHAVIGAVETALQKTPNLAEYLSGPKSLIPDRFVPKDVADGRQAFQKLFNITLKNRSGAAVTNQELERLKQEFATGVWKTSDQLEGGVKQARKIIDSHYKSIAGGFGPETVNKYNQQVEQLGGAPLNTGGSGGVKFLGFE